MSDHGGAVGEAYSYSNPESGSLMINARISDLDLSSSAPDFIPVRITNGVEYLDNLKRANNAFGDTVVTDLTPLVQLDFDHGINSKAVRSNTGLGATTAASSSVAELTISTTPFSFASLHTHDRMKYRSGQGALARWTTIYAAPEALCTQQAGPANARAGLQFGYPTGSIEFSIIHKANGRPAIYQLNITTASSTSETANVVLDGISASFSLSNNGLTTETANQIAYGNYDDVALYGWDAQSSGSSVCFIARSPGIRTGSFSLVATTASGSFVAIDAGGANTVFTTPQSEWNMDKFDGSGSSGVLLDPAKGNVYQVAFQFLGYGNAIFSIENSNTGVMTPCHQLLYSNRNTDPVLGSTVLPMQWVIASVGSSTAKSMKAGSVGLFKQGVPKQVGLHHSISTSAANIGTSLTPILSIKPLILVNNKQNFSETRPISLSIAVDGTKPADVKVVINSTLTGSIWTHPNENSDVLIDTSATSFTGGNEVFASVLAKDDSIQLDLNKLADLVLHGFPDEDTLTIAIAATAGTTDVAVALAWLEEV